MVGNYRTSGIIRDDNSNPIAGVTVKIADKTVITNENGYWEATGLFAGEHEVIATKDGYNFRPTTCALSIGQDCQPKIKPASLLDIRVTSNPSKPKQGENITYTATITNNGDQAATGINFIDVLPVGSQLVSITGSEGSNCNTDTVSCTLADLEAGATATISLVVSNSQANRLANTVTLVSNEYPASVETKRSTVIPYLSVSMTDNSPATIGGNLFYTVKIKLSGLAPTAATGVQLAIQLPKGVDYQPIVGCTIDDLLIATCDIGDMDIDSETIINVSGTITDGRLLSMTAQTKVNDQTKVYTHTAKKTTKILIPMSDDFKADMCVSLDITGSMGEEIGAVKIATKTFVEEYLATTNQSPLMMLIVFKDNVKLSTFTTDSAAFLKKIEGLQVSGGGDCPESSVKALQEYATYTKNGGAVLSATDAPSHATEAELDAVINTLVGKGIKPVIIWTQGCQAQQ
ncbi:MAG: carboxypeptidase regulatory-like domain-containing protein [Candidatus Marithrix sp.]